MNEKDEKKKLKDVKLPLINTKKKENITKGSKTTTNKNKENSTISILSQNSLKTNSMKTSNLDKKANQNNEDIKTNTFNSSNKNKIKPNTNTTKSDINNELVKNKTSAQVKEIINNVNKTRNIITNINNNNNINNMNSFNSSSSSKKEVHKKLINRKKKYKFKIYKPLNPLLAPHEDMSFVNNKNITKEKFYKELSNSMPRMSKEKLEEIRARRNARLEKEKRKIENNNKKIMDDIMGQNSIIKSREIVLNDILNSINTQNKMTHKNAQKILEEGGMIEAYKYLIKNLCKNGMPEGNVYDYCSEFIKHFERVWHKIKFKILNKKIEEHFKEKKELLVKNNENNKDNIQYKILEYREEMKFIKKLDKSRSSLHITKRNPKTEFEINKNSDLGNENSKMNSKINKNKIILNKKEEIKSTNTETRNNKNLERKNSNKDNISEQNSDLNNKLLKKNSISSNKVTFNIKLKKEESEKNLTEEKKVDEEKEKEEKEKDKSKNDRKSKQKEIDKTEKEINSKNKNETLNSKISENKDSEIKVKDNIPIVKKEKKKSSIKKEKKGKGKLTDNKIKSD